MDTVQILLLVVVIVLTILLIALGIQVFFILRELRRTIHKANKVLDNAGSISASVSKPIEKLSSLATGIQAGAVIASVLKRLKKEKD